MMNGDPYQQEEAAPRVDYKDFSQRNKSRALDLNQEVRRPSLLLQPKPNSKIKTVRYRHWRLRERSVDLARPLHPSRECQLGLIAGEFFPVLWDILFLLFMFSCDRSHALCSIAS